MQRFTSIWNDSPFRHPRAMVAGVCAELGDRFRLPAWVLRIVLLAGFTQGPWILGGGYIVAAIALRTRLTGLLPASTLPSHRSADSTTPGPSYVLQRERFSALEIRLARLEAVVTSDELKLQMRFHDLDDAR